MLKIMNYLDYTCKAMGMGLVRSNYASSNQTCNTINAKALALWGYGIRELDRGMRTGIEWVPTYNGNSICTLTARSRSTDWLGSANIDPTQMCQIIIISMIFYTVE